MVASHLELPKHLLKDSEVFEHDEEGEVGGGHPKSRPLLSVVEEMLSISLLLNPAFLLIAVSNLLGMLGFYVPFVFLPNMAAQTGISKENANFLLSIIGISNTLGRVLSGKNLSIQIEKIICRSMGGAKSFAMKCFVLVWSACSALYFGPFEWLLL